jgi:hypothetical protein
MEPFGAPRGAIPDAPRGRFTRPASPDPLVERHAAYPFPERQMPKMIHRLLKNAIM